MSRIVVTLGLLIIIASMWANFAMGTQVALIGIGLILCGLFVEIRQVVALLAKGA